MNKLQKMYFIRNILIILTAIVLTINLYNNFFKKTIIEDIETDRHRYSRGLIITRAAGVSSLHALMNIKDRKSYGDIKIYTGNIGSSDIVVSICEEGNFNVIAATAIMLSHYNVGGVILINTGISLSKNLRVGTIAVGSNLYYFDYGPLISSDYPITQNNRIYAEHYDTSTNVIERDRIFIKLRRRVDKSIISYISTGSTKIMDKTHAEELEKVFNINVADTESAAVSIITNMFGKPYVSISIVIESAIDPNAVGMDLLARDKEVCNILETLFDVNKNEKS